MEEREKQNPLMFIYKWLGLLSPFLYFIFALNCITECEDVECYLELLFGVVAGINVIGHVLLRNIFAHCMHLFLVLLRFP